MPSNEELMRLRYRTRRYLEHATDDELARRLRDVMANLTTLTPAGQIGPLPLERGGAVWMEAFTHLLEEYKLRGKTFPPGMMRGTSLPKPTFPARPRAARLLDDISHLTGRPYLVKLGDAKYLQETFRTGVWRIAPASSYADPSLNRAQRDTELELTKYALRSEVRIQVPDGNPGEGKEDVMPLGNVTVTSTSITDYYVSCLAKRLDLRLFDDFEADSCIVVHDVVAFARRMLEAVEQHLTGWHGWLQNVTYIDPFNWKQGDADVFCTKHFRYSYQQEVRFVWLPDHPQKRAIERWLHP